MAKCDSCGGIGAYIGFLCCAAFVAVVAWFSGWAHGRHETFLEAVKENHAHWVADKETGRPYIEWNK